MNNEEQIKLLLHWVRNVKRAQYGHYRMSHKYKMRFRCIGIAITLISGIGGSAFLVDIQKYSPGYRDEISIVIGFGLLVSALLSAIQTLLRFDEKAKEHYSVATKYSAAKRHLSQLIAEAKTEIVSKQRIDESRRTLDSIAIESPQIPDNVLNKIEKHMPSTPFKKYFEHDDNE